MTITREALEADLRLAEVEQYAAAAKAAYIRQLLAFLEREDGAKPDISPGADSIGPA